MKRKSEILSKMIGRLKKVFILFSGLPSTKHRVVAGSFTVAMGGPDLSNKSSSHQY